MRFPTAVFLDTNRVIVGSKTWAFPASTDEGYLEREAVTMTSKAYLKWFIPKEALKPGLLEDGNSV